MNTAQLNPHFLSYVDKRRYGSNIITTWYLSGLKMKVFCQTHPLSLKQFRRWFYKLHLVRPVALPATEEMSGDTAQRSQAMTFMPVTIAGLKEASRLTQSGGLTLVLASGERLELEEGFNEGLLCQVLRLKGGCRC